MAVFISILVGAASVQGQAAEEWLYPSVSRSAVCQGSSRGTCLQDTRCRWLQPQDGQYCAPCGFLKCATFSDLPVCGSGQSLYQVQCCGQAFECRDRTPSNVGKEKGNTNWGASSSSALPFDCLSTGDSWSIDKASYCCKTFGLGCREKTRSNNNGNNGNRNSNSATTTTKAPTTTTTLAATATAAKTTTTAARTTEAATTTTSKALDCAAVLCMFPNCANGATATVPEGGCCPVCPANTGSSSFSEELCDKQTCVGICSIDRRRCVPFRELGQSCGSMTMEPSVCAAGLFCDYSAVPRYVMDAPGVCQLEPLFNCRTRDVWSAEKIAWCCKNMNLGCPTSSSGSSNVNNGDFTTNNGNSGGSSSNSGSSGSSGSSSGSSSSSNSGSSSGSSSNNNNNMNCALVRCAYPNCADGTVPVVPVGQCCPQCGATVLGREEAVECDPSTCVGTCSYDGKTCVPFRTLGSSCGGYTREPSVCAPGLQCDFKGVPMGLADAPGRCTDGPACPYPPFCRPPLDPNCRLEVLRDVNGCAVGCGGEVCQGTQEVPLQVPQLSPHLLSSGLAAESATTTLEMCADMAHHVGFGDERVWKVTTSSAPAGCYVRFVSTSGKHVFFNTLTTSTTGCSKRFTCLVARVGEPAASAFTLQTYGSCASLTDKETCMKAARALNLPVKEKLMTRQSATGAGCFYDQTERILEFNYQVENQVATICTTEHPCLCKKTSSSSSSTELRPVPLPPVSFQPVLPPGVVPVMPSQQLPPCQTPDQCKEGYFCLGQWATNQPRCTMPLALGMGVCKPKPQMCTMIFQQVCGCNGKTYSNECSAHSAGINIAKEGPC